MCEIYVTAGKFKEAFLRSLPPIRENGRGFALIYAREVRLLRDLDVQSVTENYLRNPKPLVSILHRRVPTHGQVSVDNTQPFSDGKRVFAHNGTLGEAYHLLKAMYPRLRGASDSRLLWEFIKDMPWEQALQLLRALGDRFVLADAQRRQIALIGSWMWNERDRIWDRWRWNEQNWWDRWGRGLLDYPREYEYVLLDYSGGELKIVASEGTGPGLIGGEGRYRRS
jgi:predicted glutamine amidotransferase